MSRPHLSPQQTRVVARLAQGDTYPQAGQHLYLATSTIRQHRNKAAKRLGARNTPHLVALAIAYRLIPAGTALTPQDGDQ